MQWKPHSCILTCPEHKFKSWLQLLKFNILHKVSVHRSSPFTVTLPTEVLNHREQRGRDRGPIRDFATFAYQHTLRLLKLEITETCISTKKRKKMLGPYGEIALRRIKSKESIKKVIHNMGLTFSLVCMQRDCNQAE